MTEDFAHYEVKRRIGYGGYGTIYQAYDTNLGRDVVLKVLHHHLVPEGNVVKRFIREARAMAFLQHINIVGIYAIEKGAPRPYIVMEYFDSINLETYLDDKVTSLEESIPILAQAAKGIDAAHRQGMIHRDIKPSNILVNKEGLVKVTDFGIAKRTQSAETTLTDPSIVLGTVWYMAPEQADINRQHEVSNSTDIYALGVVAYQMLVGRVPFDSKNKDVIMAAHRTQPPPNPQIYGVSLPPEVVKVLMKVLAKQPANRYPTAQAFVKALRSAANLPESLITGVLKADEVPTIVDVAELLPGQIHKTTFVNESKGKTSHNRPLLTALMIVFMLCLVASLYQAALNQLPGGEEAPLALVQASFINLREGPGEEYPILEGYEQDTQLKVIGREEKGIWLKVETRGNMRGWVIADLLDIKQSLNQIVIVTTPTIQLTPPALAKEPNPTAYGPSNPILSTSTPLIEPNEANSPVTDEKIGETSVPSDLATSVASATIEASATQTAAASATQIIEATQTVEASATQTIEASATATPLASTETPSSTPQLATSTVPQPTETAIPPTHTLIPPTITASQPTNVAEAGNEARNDAETRNEAETEAEAGNDAENEVETEAEAGNDAENDAETRNEAETEAGTETEAGNEAKNDAETESEAGNDAKNDAETRNEAGNEAGNDAESGNEAGNDADTEPTAIPIFDTATPIPTITVAPATMTLVPATVTLAQPTATLVPATVTLAQPTAVPQVPSNPSTHPYEVTLTGASREAACSKRNYIFGFVQDQAGNPLANVLLKVQNDRGFVQYETRTNSKGLYEIDIWPVAERWYIEVTDEAYSRLSMPIEVVNNGNFITGHACSHQVNFSRIN